MKAATALRWRTDSRGGHSGARARHRWRCSQRVQAPRARSEFSFRSPVSGSEFMHHGIGAGKPGRKPTLSPGARVSLTVIVLVIAFSLGSIVACGFLLSSSRV